MAAGVRRFSRNNLDLLAALLYWLYYAQHAVFTAYFLKLANGNSIILGQEVCDNSLEINVIYRSLM
ncbi:hypothetical protein HMPREF9080_02459 [Cardiobacterium valvarum F0432]|uniref:Uncharacterized protein n=1 Tax=Cardiobacterium valvarum F0432 TaxID=797473 RepID=G9ZI50_9GAMM|nr:hypothetical protein HMPREF9080_02459 [Cardiobacterium valvarum F0432]